MRYIIFLALSLVLSSCVTYNGIPSDLSKVNKQVNSLIAYTNDLDGKDYWQSPRETVDRGKGDCEDFSLLKASLIPDDYVWELVLVYVEEKQQQHIVLLVNGQYVLDNNSNEVYLWSQMKHIVLLRFPKYSTMRPVSFTSKGEAIYE